MPGEFLKGFSKFFTNLSISQRQELDRIFSDLQNSKELTSLDESLRLLKRKVDQRLPIPELTVTATVRGAIIEWGALPDQRIIFYEIDISTVSNFASFDTVTTFSTQIIIDGLSQTKFVRVRGVRRDGTTTPYSDQTTVAPTLFDIQSHVAEAFYTPITGSALTTILGGGISGTSAVRVSTGGLAVIQTKAGNTVKTATFDSNTVAGNSIVVLAGTQNVEVTDVTDDNSNTYVKLVSNTTGSRLISIWLANSITGGATTTVTFTAAGESIGTSHIVIAELQGDLEVDQTNTADTGSDTNHHGGGVTTAHADTIVIMGTRLFNAYTVSSRSESYVQLDATTRMETQYQIYTNTVTTDADWTSDATEDGTNAMVSLNEIAVAADALKVDDLAYTPINPNGNSMVWGFISGYADPVSALTGENPVQIRVMVTITTAAGDATTEEYQRLSFGEFFNSLSIGPFIVEHPDLGGSVKVRVDVEDTSVTEDGTGRIQDSTYINWVHINILEIGSTGV